MTGPGGDRLDRFVSRRHGAASERVKDAAASLREALELLPERSRAAQQVRAALLVVNPIQDVIQADLDDYNTGRTRG